MKPESTRHNHSYLGTLRGLLLFGLLTGQSEYVDAVASTYKNALWKHNITESGWTPHDLGKTRFPNEDGDPVAETASCGDVAQLGLWLALRCNRINLLDDVERLIRSRIFPAQISEADIQHFGNISETEMRRRLGGWGVHGNAYGKGCIHDVLAAVLHMATDVYNSIVERSSFGLAVNLSLDYSGPLATIETERTEQAKITVIPKIHDNVMVRIPQWAPEDSISVAVGKQDYPAFCVGSWLHVRRSDISPGSEIVVRYDLPERTSNEVLPSGKSYNLKWKGDQVVGISPHESPLCIYDPM